MLSRLARHIAGNAVAYVALFVAMGGVSYAAVAIPAHSVGTKQLKNGAVTGAKVKAHSLLGSDFRTGQLPQGRSGPAGAQGVAGPAGAPGSAFAYAHYNSGLDAAQSKNVSSITPTEGGYCVTVDGTPHNASATVELAEVDAAGGVAMVTIDPTLISQEITGGLCPVGTNAIVGVYDSHFNPATYPFFLTFN